MVLKKDDGYEYVEVNFQMRHEKCWTEVTEELHVNIHTVSSNVYRDKNYISGTIEVKAESEKEFKKFLALFKRSHAINEVVMISSNIYRRNLYEVSFREQYNNMISTILYENNAIYHSFIILLVAFLIYSSRADFESPVITESSLR